MTVRQSLGHLCKAMSGPELDLRIGKNRSGELFRRLLNEIGRLPRRPLDKPACSVQLFLGQLQKGGDTLTLP